MNKEYRHTFYSI
ncbi:hypothetical protein TrST_g7596, partial [Triparma strigata]